MQLVIGAGRTAAIQSRFRSVTTATTPSRRRPWASRARQPVGPGVERPIGQGAVAVHGRDSVRVVPHVLLEQLVDPTVRYRSPRAGEPFERWRSPDGHTLATASVDQTVLLWDLTDLTRPRRVGDPLTGHTDDVYAVAFARDGHTLATASGDGPAVGPQRPSEDSVEPHRPGMLADRPRPERRRVGRCRPGRAIRGLLLDLTLRLPATSARARTLRVVRLETPVPRDGLKRIGALDRVGRRPRPTR